MKNLILATCLIAISTAAIGCHGHVHSPPARIAPFESSKPVPAGRTSGGVSAGANGEIFGPSVANATARVRHGVTENSEIGFDANMMEVDDTDAAAAVDPTIWSARVGGKWAPEPFGGHLALIYGVGGGTSAGGEFISPDAGIIVAFENRYAVPFFSVDGFVSEPINPKPVDISNRDDGAGTDVMTARRTWGATFAGGVKAPIQTGNSTVSPFIGFSHTRLTDGREGAQYWGPGIGVDVTFE